MEPVPPFWFKQRQGTMEPTGEDAHLVKAPNLDPAVVLIRRSADGGWEPAVRRQADGPDLVAGARSYANRADAWNAAFELFRNLAVV